MTTPTYGSQTLKITRLTPAPPLGHQAAPLGALRGAQRPGKRAPSADARPPSREGPYGSVCECLCVFFAHQDCTGSADRRVLIGRSGMWRSLGVCSPCLADLAVRVPRSALRWPA